MASKLHSVKKDVALLWRRACSVLCLEPDQSMELQGKAHASSALTSCIPTVAGRSIAAGIRQTTWLLLHHQRIWAEWNTSAC
mmetsp:Transcript_23152/g.38012  ORF Transcript_23152/g.38012 Transcript_23152/m.38012 type:complete len:82 (-) Transcript_23152:51-296(-)